MRKELIKWSLLLIVIFANRAFSQSSLGLQSVGGRIGLVLPEGDIDNALALCLNASLGNISPAITLHGYCDFWTSQYRVSDYDWRWLVLSLAGIGKYQIPMQGKIKPYVGGGFSFSLERRSSQYTGTNTPAANAADSTETSANKLNAAIHLLGGAAVSISPKLDSFAELKYTIDGADYLGIYVGVSYKLK